MDTTYKPSQRKLKSHANVGTVLSYAGYIVYGVTVIETRIQIGTQYYSQNYLLCSS